VQRLAARNGASNGSCGERPAFEALCQRRLQQPLRILQLARSRETLIRELDERAACQRAGGIGHRRYEPLLGPEMIVLAGLDALACMRFGVQVQAITERLQQAFLEDPQLWLERRAVAQSFEGLMIGVEQRRQRIVSGRELHQQLVQIERRHETRGRQGRCGLRALGTGELCRLSATGPGEQQHLEWLEDGG